MIILKIGNKKSLYNRLFKSVFLLPRSDELKKFSYPPKYRRAFASWNLIWYSAHLLNFLLTALTIGLGVTPLAN